MIDNCETYSLLFVDSFVAALLLPLNRVLIFKIMHYFGGYNPILTVTIASLSSLLGGMVNWYCGRMVAFARMGYHKQSDHGLQHLQVFLIPLIIICAWIPVAGGILTVTAGYICANSIYVCFALFVSYFAYYASVLLIT